MSKRLRDLIESKGPVIEILDDSSEDAMPAAPAKRQRLDPRQQAYDRWSATMTELQRKALDLALLGGQNIFVTGPPGAGKSHVLKAIVECVDPWTTAVTASTGVAATLVNGVTLHWFFGIGLAKEPLHVLIAMINNRGEARDRIRQIDRLIIDEISMVGGDLFDKLDGLCRSIRREPSLPFGGLTLLLFGDFLQLAPIPDEGKPLKFAFESDAWRNATLQTIELEGTHRQQDADFIAILSELRLGQCSDMTASVLQSYVKPLPVDDPDAVVSFLYPRNAQADDMNKSKLGRLAKSSPTLRIYQAEDCLFFGTKPTVLEKLRVPAKLELRVGAQVMLLANVAVKSRLANGTSGRVVGFAHIAPHYPIVCFKLATGGTHTMTVTPWQFKVEARGQLLAERIQVPLMLSWSYSIHKSQGDTIRNHTVIDMGPNIFAEGQGYVALSRITTLDDLTLTAFDRTAIRANAKVLAWLAQNKALETTTVIHLDEC